LFAIYTGRKSSSYPVDSYAEEKILASVHSENFRKRQE
jgi:hypothetical protein